MRKVRLSQDICVFSLKTVQEQLGVEEKCKVGEG
jgi:hypothetical protein